MDAAAAARPGRPSSAAPASGVSGYLLQTLTRNPLAGPGLTGVMSGAVAPIVFSLRVPALALLGLLPARRHGGGLGAALATFWIARGHEDALLHLALGGIGVSLFLGAITTLPPHPRRATGAVAAVLAGRRVPGPYMDPARLYGSLGHPRHRRRPGVASRPRPARAQRGGGGRHGLQLAVWKPFLLLLAILPVAGIVPVAQARGASSAWQRRHIARLLNPHSPGWTVALTASSAD